MSKVAAVPLEPTPQALANPVKRYVLATRPAFLTITLVGCLLGFATAPAFSWGLAVLTLLLALAAHAGVNVLNDYYDHLNGTDAANTERLFPFTGGSRFIQTLPSRSACSSWSACFAMRSSRPPTTSW